MGTTGAVTDRWATLRSVLESKLAAARHALRELDSHVTARRAEIMALQEAIDQVERFAPKDGPTGATGS